MQLYTDAHMKTNSMMMYKEVFFSFIAYLVNNKDNNILRIRNNLIYNFDTGTIATKILGFKDIFPSFASNFSQYNC